MYTLYGLLIQFHLHGLHYLLKVRNYRVIHHLMEGVWGSKGL